MTDALGRFSTGFTTGLQLGEQRRANLVREAQTQQQIDLAVQQATGKSLNDLVTQQNKAFSDIVGGLAQAREAGNLTDTLVDRAFQMAETFNQVRRASGLPEIDARTQIETALRAVQTPQEAGQAAAETEVSQALSTLDFIEGSELPENIRTALKQRLRFTDDQSTDSFLRALAEHDRLAQKIADGAATQLEQERFELVKRRVQSLSRGAGQTFTVSTVGPNGEVTTMTVGPATQETAEGEAQPGTFPRLPATAQQTSSERLASIDTSIGLIDELLVDVPENPQDFGLTASFRSTAQTAIGTLSDAAEGIAAATGGSIDLNAAADLLTESFGIEGTFDPDLPRLESIERRLATALFKLRLQTAGQQGRSLQSMMNQALQDVRLRGLTTSKDITARLNAVRQEFEAERGNISRGLLGTEQVPRVDTQQRIQEIESRLGGELDEEEELQLRLELEQLRQ